MANRSKTNPSTRASTSKLPAWITSHFQESLDALDLLMNMIRISQRGIRMLRAVPNAIQVLSSVNGAKADSTTDTPY